MTAMKVSDYIAQFCAEKGMSHVFGIIGSGNAHIFDSIHYGGKTQIVCVHHEQAACMAAQTYFRVSGRVTAALLTTGAGSLNGVTGVVSAWADSIPMLVISSNENSRYIRTPNPLRMWGIQGYDSVGMVERVTKYAVRVTNAADIRYELEKAYELSIQGRPGPCWVDVPMNVQAESIDPEAIRRYPGSAQERLKASQAAVTRVWEGFRAARRPLIWAGHGIRLAGAERLLKDLVERVQVPTLVSWAGIDMLDSSHPLNFGRAGVYGQRAANLTLQSCDYLLAIGTRLAIPQIGYEPSEFARGAKIVVVDIDPGEAGKLGPRADQIVADAGEFLAAILRESSAIPCEAPKEWVRHCVSLRSKYPWVGPEHADTGGFINSYPFMNRLAGYFKQDQVVVTDMGTALLSGHQVLPIRPGQRLMTSTGLGEMGYGLPGAIGASFARGKGEVLCLNCDGGMMMNLQELQTVAHHRLPIKLIIFNNDGYLMIKHTQKAMLGGRYAGTDKSTGVSCPDFSKLAGAFGIPAAQVRTWAEFDAAIGAMQASEGPMIVEVFMDPGQLFVPKLSLAVAEGGALISPPLEDLSPLLSREALKADMLVPLHPKSEKLVPNPARG